MYKKLVVFLLVVSLTTLSGITLAEDNNGTHVLKLSLENCVQKAYENNLDMKNARLKLEKEEVEYDKMEDDYDRYEDSGGFTNTYDEKLGMRVGMTSAEMELRMAKKGLNNQKLVTRQAVESSYYSALLAKKSVEICKLSLERAQEQLRVAELKFKFGKVAKKDILDAEAEVASARADYNSALRQRDIAYLNLKKLINISLDTPIKLTSKLEFNPVQDINLEEDIQYALENNFEAVMAREAVKVAEKAFEVAENVYAPNVYEYRIKKYELEQAKNELEKALVDTKVKVRNAYYELKSQEESIPALRKSLNSAKESLRLAKLRYDAGLMTGLDVLRTINMVKAKEIELAQAIMQYNTAKANYRLVVGKDIQE